MTSPERLVGGRYRLAEKIGHGGMGQVWAAYDERLDRRVAVKLLHSAALEPGRRHGEDTIADLRRRFGRECRVTAAFDHPGLVTVYDAGADGDELYLVMQRVHGASLADLVAERGRFPVPWAVATAAQICAALAEVHAVPVVHRDLKPSNVMVREDGRVVVLDLGIAAVLEGGARITRTGDFIGSPDYMAPEQALSATTDPRSDLYALGCMLHEMLVGEPPFRATTALGVLRRHAEDPPVPVRELRPETPAALEALLLDLLAKQPAGRPSSAQEVHRRLAPLLPAPDPVAVPRPYAPLPDPTRPYRYPLAPRPAPAHASPAGPDAGTADPGAADVGTVDVGAADSRAAATPAGLDVAAACRRVSELVEAGRYAEVVDLAEQVLPVARYQQGDHAPMVRILRRLYAQALLVERRHRDALPEFRLLAATAIAERGPDDAGALEYRRQAALCLEQLGESRPALAEYRALLPLLHARLERGADTDPRPAFELRERIGHLLLSDGDVAGAWAEFSRLLLERERHDGRHHPEVVRLRQTLDWLLLSRTPAGSGAPGSSGGPPGGAAASGPPAGSWSPSRDPRVDPGGFGAPAQPG